MTVHVRTDGPVAVVTIDRPEVANAIDRPTADALAGAFRRFDADDSLAVAVLTGAGGRFCAGADLKAISAVSSGDAESAGRVSRVGPDGDGPVGPTRLLLTKPVVAAVEGHAVAGGLELALWCDLRVAAADATFGVYCRRWGVPLMARRLARLPQAALRSDRRSSYDQWSLPLTEALLAEYHHGMATLATGETFAGVDRYARGDWSQEDFA